MKIFKKPIFVSISPNAQADDVWLALKLFFMPWKWKNGKCIKKFEEMLRKYLFCHPEPFDSAQDKLRESGVKDLITKDSSPTVQNDKENGGNDSRNNGKIHPSPPLLKEGGVVLFESGRTALYAILMALGIKQDDEVLVQAFTCTAAVNPILWVGARPVYVDIENGTYNISSEDLEKKITPKSKVVIMQHTFGFPAKIDEISEIAKRHNLIVLEDCAHSLGAEYSGQKVGLFGEASFFSFGRSKVISSVFGGAAFTKNQELAEKIREIHNKWQYPSCRWIAQQLFHPIYLAIAKLLYNFFNIGKLMIIIGKKLKLISIMVYSVEKSGGKPPFGPAKMPNALACLAIKQMRKLEKFNKHRRELAGFYREQIHSFCHSEPANGRAKNLAGKDETLHGVYPEQGRRVQDDKNCEPVFLNFPVQVKSFGIRWKLIGKAKKQGIYLESWPAKDKKVIGPDSVNQEMLFYEEGLCPNAELSARTSINLPTNPNTTKNDAKRVVSFLKEFFKNSLGS